MGASVRIEPQAFTDPRFGILGRLLGASRFEALGRMIHVWGWCTERDRHDVPVFFLAGLFDGDVDLFSSSVVAAELGSWIDCTEPGNHPPNCRHIRIKGTAGRIEWLSERRKSAPAGGRARAASATRDERGRMVSQQASSQVAGERPANIQPGSPATSSAPAPAPALTKKEIGAAKRRLPPDWSPSEQHAALALSLGVDLEREKAKFRDHFVAHGKPLADWDAAFRNWLRKANDFAPGAKGSPPSGLRPPPLKLLGVD